MARKKKDNIDRKRYTTLLPEQLTKKIKHAAIENGKNYYEIVEAALKEYLGKEKKIKLK